MLVLVHGSWVDARTWRPILPILGRRFRAVAYDRRGHGRSSHPPGQGSVRDDVGDLAALIESLDQGPAHLVGNSFGGSIVLRLAGQRSDLVRSIAVHEPPLPRLLERARPAFADFVRAMEARVQVASDRLAAGDLEGGARAFVDATEFQGAWDRIPPQARAIWIENALTFLDEELDPETRDLDLGPLATYTGPALLTRGERGAAFFADVLEVLAEALPHATVKALPAMGHAPHLTAPDAYAALLNEFALQRVP